MKEQREILSRNGVNNAKGRVLTAIIVILPFAAALVCIGIGRYHISVPDTVKALASLFTGAEIDHTTKTVIFGTRIPRILLAMLVGSGLASSGAAFQALFGNPLATPDTLGVATGASFGAVLALLFSNNMALVQANAVIFGLLALGVTMLISRTRTGTSILMVILAGMVVGALFNALISLVKYMADPDDKLPAITYWLMGSLTRTTLKGLLMCIPMISVGLILLVLLRWRLNVLSLPDDEAKSIVPNVRRLRGLVMVGATLSTAAVVALCGQVGWIGLLVPHIARMLYGSDNRKVLPISIALGAALMVVIDTIARSMIAAEIPVSILTAMVGAPLFIALLRRTGGSEL
jgi:iron complex transport system permease protein